MPQPARASVPRRLRPPRDRPVRGGGDERSTSLSPRSPPACWPARARPSRRCARRAMPSAASRISAGTTWATSRRVRRADLPEHVPSSIAALTPAPKPRPSRRHDAEPEVVAQQRAIAESFDAERSRPRPSAERRAEAEPAPSRVVARSGAGRRAAQRRGRAAGRAGQEGRLHAAPRRRAPSAPAPRHRGHRPLGAADRDRGARPIARRPFPKSKRWPSGFPPRAASEAEPEKAEAMNQDRLQGRRLDADRRDDDGRASAPSRTRCAASTTRSAPPARPTARPRSCTSRPRARCSGPARRRR